MMRENRNILERTGATSELSSRRNLVGMLSGPDALLGLRLVSRFSTHIRGNSDCWGFREGAGSNIR